ncbi:MAG: YggS family pyridoxal phosphate-dependent enzyme [Alphaproteobacteria bacterium GM7ARS4]|nr:YggS family pyridoxal phosphate-dependent enzyme [Alphaproteobacteria bacterium GM7ARS4]
MVEQSLRARLRALSSSLIDHVTLVAVSKTQSVDAIKLLLGAGHRVFAENRIQEAIEKWRPLRQAYPSVELHYIGHLQRNKVSQAFDMFDVIESLDSERLAKRCAYERHQRGGLCPALWVQVNIGEEAQKGGIHKTHAQEFVTWVRHDLTIPINGLMAIPPVGEDPAPYFQQMQGLAQACAVSCLSMGMSADYTIAMRYGATHVRLGTALFGARPA